ncbi:Uncharacterized protein FVE85_5883 [Porphyridium purpureum]|uniref:COX assembly mitochondrial protein n=1 Tax=Porphyridium purpureum TaxID=35688 RepID=A0A5J4Z510_PORPP|nr:Uncharacterized protein FVE85_5883 [Porphyridium purpureum]|eukprot:POR1207..scf295_1
MVGNMDASHESSDSGADAPAHSIQIPEGMVPVLRARAREHVRKEWIDTAWMQCDPETKAFYECSKREGLMVVFKCRGEKNVLNDCLKQFSTEENHIALKIAWARAHPEEVMGWEPRQPRL